ncbi:MAG TPA: hypothetical protein VLV49_08435 [Terriglobales bacterium]|nr:hypothetical protein [Terriglobales bacterium]
MLIEKLSGGVLRVLTPLGPRYIQPTFAQRVYLLWVFRHFEILPLQVLSRRQQKLVDELCAGQHFVSFPGMDDAPVLGTVERRPPVEVEELPPRRPNARASEEAVSGLARGAHQGS